jgi:hypothetical protein
MIPLQCASCVHYQGANMCPAFPEGIPEPILTNEVLHNKPTPEQKGSFVFEEDRSAR